MMTCKQRAAAESTPRLEVVRTITIAFCAIPTYDCHAFRSAFWAVPAPTLAPVPVPAPAPVLMRGRDQGASPCKLRPRASAPQCAARVFSNTGSSVRVANERARRTTSLALSSTSHAQVATACESSRASQFAVRCTMSSLRPSTYLRTCALGCVRNSNTSRPHAVRSSRETPSGKAARVVLRPFVAVECNRSVSRTRAKFFSTLLASLCTCAALSN